jgi:broad specificity phosphatase PhoE
MTDNAFTQLSLLRHGELATAGLFCAHADEPLSEKGLANLRNITATEKTKPWDVIITSPKKRCLDFAKELSQEHRIPLELIDGFKEMDFGEWVGQPTDKLWKNSRESLESLWKLPKEFVAPEGEAMTDFIQRVETSLKNLLDKYSNQSILLITHAGVIRVILAKSLGIDYLATQRFMIDYASLTQIHHYPSGDFSLYSHGVRPNDRNA